MKTSIIYNSHSGTTKAYAEEIGNFLTGHGQECRVSSIEDYDREFLDLSDLVLLGCWTSGLPIKLPQEACSGKWRKLLPAKSIRQRGI